MNDVQLSQLDDNGFDKNSGNSWIFPRNYEKRQYQYNISKAALFKNTLVVLPTGLGKTFIASVIIYNIFRWFPKSKIIFMVSSIKSSVLIFTGSNENQILGSNTSTSCSTN